MMSSSLRLRRRILQLTSGLHRLFLPDTRVLVWEGQIPTGTPARVSSVLRSRSRAARGGPRRDHRLIRDLQAGGAVPTREEIAQGTKGPDQNGLSSMGCP